MRLAYTPAFSTPAFSTLAFFDRIAFSTPAFSVASRRTKFSRREILGPEIVALPSSTI